MDRSSKQSSRAVIILLIGISLSLAAPPGCSLAQGIHSHAIAKPIEEVRPRGARDQRLGVDNPRRNEPRRDEPHRDELRRDELRREELRRDELRPEELYDIAALHYSRSAWQMAIKNFERLQNGYADHPLAKQSHFYRGEAFVELQQFDLAITSFQSFVEQRPNDDNVPRAQYRIAECYFLQQRDDAGLRLMQAFVFDHERHPLCEYALPILGRLRLDRNEPQIAEQIFRRHQVDFPESGLAEEISFGLARSLQMQGQYAEAIAMYTALQNDSDFKQRDYCLLELGRLCYYQQQYRAAADWLDQLVELDSQLQTQGRLILARVHSALQQFDLAQAALSGLSSLDQQPELSAAISIEQARIEIEQNNLEAALAILKPLLDDLDDPYWLDYAIRMSVEICEANENRERIVQLGELYAQKVKQGTSWYFVGLRRAIAEYNLGRPQAARRTLNDLVNQLDADQLAQQNETRYWLAVCDLAENDYPAALQRLASVDPDQLNSQGLASVKRAQAVAYLALKQYPMAADLLRQYLKLRPDDTEQVEVKLDLVLALVKTDRLAAADQVLDSLEDVTDSQLQDRLVHSASQLAWGGLKNEQYELAEKWYRSVLAWAEDSAARRDAVQGLACVAGQAGMPAVKQRNVQRLIEFISGGDGDAARLAVPLAIQLEESRRMDLAVELLEAVETAWKTNALPATPDVATALHKLAQAKRHTDPQRCLRLLTQVVVDFDQAPNRDQAMYELARVQTETGAYPGARQRFQQLIEEHPQSPLRSDAIYRLAKLELQAEDRGAARRWFLKLVDVPTDSFAAHANYQLGKLAISDHDWTAAQEYMEAVTEQFSDSELAPLARYWNAESLFQLDDYKRSLQSFQLLDAGQLPRSRRFRVQLRTAQLQAALGNWDQVQPLCQSALTDFSDMPQVYQFEYLLGRTRMEQARFAAARDLFRNVVHTAGKTETAAMAQWMIGETYFHQREFEEAINQYYLVESQHPYTQWTSAALLQAAKCYEHLGQSEPAQQLLQHIADLPADNQFTNDARDRIRRRAKAAPAAFRKTSNQPGDSSDQ